jgi:hypothetical protein
MGEGKELTLCSESEGVAVLADICIPTDSIGRNILELLEGEEIFAVILSFAAV